MDFTLTGDYPVPARTLFETLSSEAYLQKFIENHRGQNIEIKTVADSGTTLELAISYTEPERGADGKPTGKQEPVEERHIWDSGALHLESTRTMPEKTFVTTRVKKTISARGDDACRIEVNGTVKIKIPILGKKIEKGIVRSIQKNWEKDLAWDLAYLESAG